jgi:P27 family predicted phage terminase small subunit
MDYLSIEGKKIYTELEKHCKKKLKVMDIDHLELSMLANSFALYSDAAKVCRDSGVSFTIVTEKGGQYEQIRPEYSVMKNEYQNILKHGAKFGLNPADRSRIFKGLDKKEKKNPVEGLD